MKVNVYDFDKTIYDGDSTVDFYLFILKKYPVVLKYLPNQVVFYILMKLKIVPKEIGKEHFFSFLKYIENIDVEIEDFWKINELKIKKWYINSKKETDIIISASPEFLLNNICKKMNVKLIASKVDKSTGKFISKNCYGNEKAVRLKEEFKKIIVEKFYTDSKSDLPLVKIAKKSYLVKKDLLIEWRE